MIWIVNRVVPVLLFLVSIVGHTLAQNALPTDTTTLVPCKNDTIQNASSFQITNFGLGGSALKITTLNNQHALMSGGRGAATINHRYTIGGAGYGTGNVIKLASNSPDTNQYLKMGYGGIELGYILFPGQRMNIGAAFLAGLGAAFTESLPAGKETEFKIFSILEPSVYGEVAVSRLIWIHAGVSYRYVNGASLSGIADRNMRGYSFYIGLMFGTCTCDN